MTQTVVTVPPRDSGLRDSHHSARRGWHRILGVPWSGRSGQL